MRAMRREGPKGEVPATICVPMPVSARREGQGLLQEGGEEGLTVVAELTSWILTCESEKSWDVRNLRAEGRRPSL
jgi:hypothetical protein